MRFIVSLILFSLPLLALAGCEEVSVTQVEVASVSVSPGNSVLVPQESVQLSATPRDASGAALPGRSVQWTSLNPDMVSVDASGVVRAIAPGTAQVRASVGGASGTASIQVVEAPRIVLSSSEMSFSAVAGEGGSETAEVQITNGGEGSLTGLEASVAWLEGEPDWLDVQLSSGTAPSTLTLLVDPSGFPAGRYDAELTVSAGGAVPVPSETLAAVLLISEAPPLIQVSPEAVGFSSSAGQGVPSPQSVSVMNIGGGELTGLTAEVEYTAGGASGWLEATLESGTAPTDLNLRVDPSELETGVYDAQVSVTSPLAEGDPGVVQVRFSLGEPPPQFEISPSSISRSVEEGDALPDEVSVVISNAGSGALGEITASIQYEGATQGWLQSQLTGSLAPTSLLVTFAPEGLLPGSYEAAAVIESPDAINSPASVALSLRVLARPLPESSTITATPDSILADGASTSTVTVSLRDARGDLVARGGDEVELTTSAGTLSSLADLGDGRYRATLTSSTSAGPALLSGLLRGEPIDDFAVVHFVPGEVSAEQSTLSAAPTRIAADGSSTSRVTVRLLDAFGNLVGVGGDLVELSTTAGSLSAVVDEGDGTYTSVLTSSTDLVTAVITGTVDGEELGDNASVEFIVGAASADRSTLEVDPASITTDGSSAVTVQLRDDVGHDLTSGGDEVFLATTLGTLDPTGGTTGSNGQFASTLTSTQPGSATITAYLGTDATGPEIGTATVTVEAGEADAAESGVSASPVSITTDETSTMTVQLRDAAGHDLTSGGDEVFLATTLGALDPTGGTTDSNGQFTSTLTSTQPGSATITAYLGTDATGPEIGTATVTVEAGEADAAESGVSASPVSITTDETSTVTVQLRDAAGNDLTSGGDEVFLATTLGTLDPTGGTTGSNGQFASTLTSGEPGSATITAYLGTDATGPEIGTATVEVTEEGGGNP